MEVRAYRRNLPHVFPKGRAIFVTWRLHGSLPASVLRTPTAGQKRTAGERFVRIDAHLDGIQRGPMWLRDERIAEHLCRTIEGGGETDYFMHEYVVMPNHVHILLTPIIEVSKLLQKVKVLTATYGNEVLGRTGKPFWQQESYDHFCRTTSEFGKIRGYIARNPVKAGLSKTPEDYPWSSMARKRMRM